MVLWILGPKGLKQARPGMMFPFGFGSCPLASGLALLPGVNRQGRVGWLVRGHGVEPGFVPEPLLGLVLSSCSRVGFVPLLGGSGRR